MNNNTNASITGLILSGGRASRMDAAGSTDKGLVKVGGISLISHVITRFAPQVDRLIINANRHRAEYAAFGYDVIADDDSDAFMGPLAGLHTVIKRLTTPLLAIVPCDAPRLPLNLVSRLASQLTMDCDFTYVTTNAQPQPTFCVLKVSLAQELTTYLASGQRSIQHWIATLGRCAVGVTFVSEEGDGDNANAFTNINTVADVRAFEQHYRA